MIRSYRSQSQTSGVSLKKWAVIVLPAVFVIGAILFNVFSFASLGTVGGELYAINVKTDQLAAQNQRLREEIAKGASLQMSLSQAEVLGFVPIAKLTQVDGIQTKVALIHE